jgi:hypothetical protein
MVAVGVIVGVFVGVEYAVNQLRLLPESVDEVGRIGEDAKF